MNEMVKAKCDLFIDNRAKMEKGFKWSNSLMNIAAALTFTLENQAVDLERLKECKKLLEKNTGIFSGFQSYGMPIVVSKMAMSNDPIQYLNDIKPMYEKICKGMGLTDSSYLIQSAICIYEADRLYDADSIIARFKELYKKMGKVHPLITSSDDVVFAMLLTLTDKSHDTIIREMEDCYNYLKKDVKLKVGSNEIQGISEVLTLSDGDMKEKCDKVVNLYNTFKEHGKKYGHEYNEFSSLGTLIDIDMDKDALVDEIIEVADYLKSAKGFSSWTLDNKQRLMFAAMIVGDTYNDNRAKATYSAINSTVAAVIAEEIALMMCIMICATSNTN